VRELRNLMERAALFLEAEPLQALTPGFLLSVAPELAAANAAGAAAAASATGPAGAGTEPIEQVLARFGGNREAAARYLGISRTTLWRRLGAAR
jgi:propionate catabolism operon transcriptional regulator